MYNSEEEQKQLYDNLVVKGEYLANRLAIGWKTGWTNIAYGFGGELSAEEKEDFENKKSEIEYLKAQTDDLWINNKDTLWGATYVAGMVAESLANPYEMAANVAVGVATGGLGVAAKIGVNVVADAAVATHQTLTIEDRLPTASEYAMNALGSVIPDVIAEYGLKKLNFNIDNAVVKGDTDVDIRLAKSVSDDYGVAEGATARAFQSQNGVVDGADLFDIKGTNIPKDTANTTFLQRRQATWEASDEGIEAMTNGVSFTRSHTTQNPLEKAVSNNVDEIKAYGTYKQGNEGAIKVTLDNVRASYENDYLNYKNQTVLIMDEYSNKLGMTQNEYLDKIGADGRNLSGSYMYGGNSVNGLDEDEFIQMIVKDADIINDGASYYRLEDLPNADELITRNHEYVDENGIIRKEVLEDKELMKRFKKSEDYNTFKYLNETPNENIKQINRIEFALNKKELLTDMYDMFETTAKSADRVGDAKLTPHGLTQFERMSAILSDKWDGWETMSRTDQINSIFDLLRSLQKSTDANFGTAAYEPFGAIAKNFNSPTGMAMFFQELNEGQYIKSNAQMLKDIMEVQSKQIAMLDVYGTTNATRLKNRVGNSSPTNAKMKKWLGIADDADLTDADRLAIRQAKEEFEVFYDNVFGGKSQSEMGVGVRASQVARDVIRRGPMYFSGIQEFITNPATAALRALKYGQSLPQTAGFIAKRQYKRMKKAWSGGLPNQPIVARRLEKKLSQRQYANPQNGSEYIKSTLEKMDNFGYKFQELSDYNLSGYGETYATSLINSLGDFANIDPEVKRVLRTAGVVEENYGKFLDFARKHLDDNDLYIDTRKLVDMGEEADMLRTVFNSISNDVGNVNSKSMFRTKALGEMEQWWGMFRSFSRNMNADTMKNMMYYTAKDGLKKTRLSVGGLQSAINPTNVMNVGTLAAFMYATGKGAQYVKDWVDGDRDFAERGALAKTRLTYAFDQGLDDEGATAIFRDIWNVVGEEQLGLSVDMLTNNNPAMSAIRKFKQAFKEASQNDSGPLSYEDLNIWGQLIFSQVLSKRAIDTRNALIDTAQGNFDDSTKIYGMSADQLQVYYARVYNNRTTVNELREAVGLIDKEVAFLKAEADYLEDKTDSFNVMPDKQKDYFQAIAQTAGIKPSEEDKAAFALMYNQAATELGNSKRDSLNEGLQEQFGITSEQVDDYIMTSQIEFDNMPEKKQEYYQRLCKYVGDKDTEANRAKFVELLGNAKAADVPKVLNDHYELDPNEFDMNRGIRPDLNAASSAGGSFSKNPETGASESSNEKQPSRIEEVKDNYYGLNLANNSNTLENIPLDTTDTNVQMGNKFNPTTNSIPQMNLDVNKNVKNNFEVNRQMNETTVTKELNKQQVLQNAYEKILEQEGTGDNATNVKTGKGGMTYSTKRALEGRYKRTLTDDEARMLYLSEIYADIEKQNPNLSNGEMSTLLGTFYNLGRGAINYDRFKKYINEPTQENLMNAILFAPTIEGQTSKGIARRKAEDYNKSNPTDKVDYVVQSQNGDITYHNKNGDILFSYKATKGKHKSSASGKIKV